MAFIPEREKRGGRIWLLAGMMLIGGGCMLPAPSSHHHFWHFNQILPYIGSAPLIFLGTTASSHAPSSNHEKTQTVLEPKEPSSDSGSKPQPPASPKTASPTSDIPAKEKNAPVPVPKVPEKENKPNVRVPAIVEKEQASPELVPEVSEKEKQPSAPGPKGLEKENKPNVRVPAIAEKEQPSPEQVPEVPEKEKKPPILVPEVPEKLNGQAVVTYKTKIEETRDLIRVIDESRLTKEQHDTFNSIHNFLEKAQEAFSQDDMSMAVNLAEKANTLAKEIVRNSP